jgi:hypothetical protein
MYHPEKDINQSPADIRILFSGIFIEIREIRIFS